MTDRVLLSRSQDSDAFGKCSERLDIPVPSDLKEGIAALATIDGQTSAQYVRKLLEMHVFGRLEVMRRMVGKGSI